MNDSVNRTLSIIGAGKVGKTIGKLLAAKGSMRLQDVVCRTEASALSAVAFMGGGSAVRDLADLRPADIYLIATPDDRIEAACQSLAEQGILSSESIVFHCSGALPSTVLHAARDRGAAIASIHPVRSFAAPDLVAQQFDGTWCGVEGDRMALDILIAAMEAIGARTVRLDTDAKIHYHAGAVFACNYLVTLLDVATQSYARAGIPRDIALQMIEPLVRETVDNVFRMEPEAALTGPVARGDMATAYRQRQAIVSVDAAHGELYAQLMRLTADLAARRKPVDN